MTNLKNWLHWEGGRRLRLLPGLLARAGRPGNRAPARVLCVGGAVLLHAVAIGIALNTALPGKRSRESSSAENMTFYVALGDATSAPSRITLATDSIGPQLLSDKARPGSGAIGSPMPKVAQERHGADIHYESLSDYLPSNQLDVIAGPVSEPAYHILDGVQSSGRPIRLRLFIDANGILKEIRVIRAEDGDSAVVTRIRAMFFTTAFLPGRRNGKDTASYIDVDINIGNTDRQAEISA